MHAVDQQTHEKMLNITNYQRNINQNYNEVPLYIGENVKYPSSKSLQAINSGEGAEKRDLPTWLLEM